MPLFLPLGLDAKREAYIIKEKRKKEGSAVEQSGYAVTCENIKKLPGCARLRIIAGAAGAFRQIRWVHYVEEPSYIQFLKGGELVLTTGLLLRDREMFLGFIRQLKSKQIAGIVINEPPEGAIPYLEDIRRLCDELELCVFSLPFHCRFADIMQSITRQIFLNQQRKHDLDTMLFSLFFDPASPYLHGSDRLNDLGQQHRHCCFALVFSGKSGSAVEPRALSGHIQERLHLCRRRLGRNMLCLLHGKELLGFFAMKEGEAAEAALTFCGEIRKAVAEAVPGIRVFAGVGEIGEGLSTVRDEMEVARRVASLAAGQEIPVLESRKCGLFRVLDQVQRPETVEELLTGVLKPLADHDAKRGGELVKTLQRYLINNGSLQKTADDLFIHYNTLRHRLRTVETLLGQDLSDYNAIFELKLAFLARQYLDGRKI